MYQDVGEIISDLVARHAHGLRAHMDDYIGQPLDHVAPLGSLAGWINTLTTTLDEKPAQESSPGARGMKNHIDDDNGEKPALESAPWGSWHEEPH